MNSLISGDSIENDFEFDNCDVGRDKIVTEGTRNVQTVPAIRANKVTLRTTPSFCKNM